MPFTKQWFKAATIRAIRTVAQTALAMIPVAVSITEVNWLAVLGTAALAGVCSILTSLAGLPEVEPEGKITTRPMRSGTGGQNHHPPYEKWDENGDPIE